MSLSRRRFLKKSAAVAAGLALPGWQPPAEAATDAGGHFRPDWDSLAQYQCPEWFRDAKFGIWAHWTAQCVPEQGDWYARQMYQQGNPDYEYQVEHYGHPSKVGFKDIDHIWHAEHWDPERLIQLYKAAGAKYFVALAQHHDNFDCFDSAHQPWNSVAIGPKKDIVGTWAKVARGHGLRFGVTSHGSHAWSWFEVAQGADKTGPLAGVPYDGKLTKADGVGQWWEGLDPQDLYAQNHRPMGLEWTWDNHGVGDLPSPAYCEKFYNRIIDLLDKYHPDLLYFDDTVLPLYPISDVGLRIAAYHYNASIRRHGGRLEAVLNGKGLNAAQQRCMVHDFERGRSDRIEPHPWQTDTCIGDWHYRRSLYENHRYKTVAQVVKMLVDIVSKNGNLLLNIPVRGDGTIDPDELAFLQGMAAWMRVNEEAIFGTRPWKIAGEGPVRVRSGGFSEGGEERLTAEDLRFTTKGDILYATAMAWPDSGKLTVRTLAASVPGIKGRVSHVELLGHGNVPFTRTVDGLVVTLPAQRPCDHAYVLKIRGLNLAASEPVAPVVSAIVHTASDASLTLTADEAALHGDQIQVESRGGSSNIGFWDRPTDSASWTFLVPQAGRYDVSARYAALAASAFTVEVAGQRLGRDVPATGSWDTLQTVPLGQVALAQAGPLTLTVRPRDAATWKAINLAWVQLTPAPKESP
ncbi:MAG: alpha-L-fucosidase [Armatimonadetes bacterium]|nr:alpha-L-fucosidase [Armatimonadota bacterium]